MSYIKHGFPFIKYSLCFKYFQNIIEEVTTGFCLWIWFKIG